MRKRPASRESVDEGLTDHRTDRRRFAYHPALAHPLPARRVLQRRGTGRQLRIRVSRGSHLDLHAYRPHKDLRGAGVVVSSLPSGRALGTEDLQASGLRRAGLAAIPHRPALLQPGHPVGGAGETFATWTSRPSGQLCDQAGVRSRVRRGVRVLRWSGSAIGQASRAGTRSFTTLAAS